MRKIVVSEFASLDELHTSADALHLYTQLGFTEVAHLSLRRRPDKEGSFSGRDRAG